MPKQQEAKRAAGERAAAMIENGMRVGLGTGSTTAFAIEALGRRIRNEGLDVTGTPTSYAAERLARQQRIPIVPLDELDGLDLAFDGADEVDPDLNLIKGRGAAHTRERVVAAEAARFVVLIDPSKEVERLGVQAAVPVEVVPMAVAPVMRALEYLGGQPELRTGSRKDGPVVTDQGLWIVDLRFGDGIDDPHSIARAIKLLPGVLDHGLFLDIATDVLVGTPDGEVHSRTRQKTPRRTKRRGG